MARDDVVPNAGFESIGVTNCRCYANVPGRTMNSIFFDSVLDAAFVTVLLPVKALSIAVAAAVAVAYHCGLIDAASDLDRDACTLRF